MTTAQTEATTTTSKKNGKAAEPKMATPRDKPETTPRAVTKKPPGSDIINVSAANAVKSIKLIVREDIVVDQSKNSRENIDPKHPDSALVETALSIRETGLVHPLTVMKRKDGKFELIAGYRRFFATGSFVGEDEEKRRFQFEAVKEVPAVVMETLDDLDRAIANGAENFQRVDLTQYEKAKKVWELSDLSAAKGTNNGKGYTALEIGRKLGMERSTAANMLGWRRLIPKLKRMLEDGAITGSQANRLYGLEKELQTSKYEAIKEGIDERKESEDNKGSKKDSKGRDKKKGARVLRTENIKELLINCKIAKEIRIGKEHVKFTDGMRDAVQVILRHVVGELTNSPIRGYGEDEAEEGDDE